jgi:hypothetical protein
MLQLFDVGSAPNPFSLEPLAALGEPCGELDAPEAASVEPRARAPLPAAASAVNDSELAAATTAQPDSAVVAACATISAQLVAKGNGPASRADTQAAILALCELRDSGALLGALDLVSLDAVNDDVQRQLFEAVATHTLSYSSCVELVKRALLSRALRLEQPASRALFATVELTLDRHPKALVDGLLVPIFTQEGIGPAQAEVVCRLLKEAVRPPFVEHFVRAAVSDERASGGWSELQVGILQQAINRKIALAPAVVLALLEQAAASGDHLKQSLKFAKLLLMLVQRFGAEVAPHAELALQIAQKGETFMKSALTKAIAEAAKRGRA